MSEPSLPHKVDEALLESFRYINSVPGKDVRGKLVDCFQLWLNVPDLTVLEAIKDIIGDLHNASLLIDDIEDNSKLRRGIPVAHSIFGVPCVINTANYVYFLALEKCHALDNPQSMQVCSSSGLIHASCVVSSAIALLSDSFGSKQVFVGELLNLHRGQGHDIAWRDGLNCPTESEYCEMVKDKTGGLFRLAVGLMQSFATTNKDQNFAPLVNNLAMYFQIRDDFINLADEEYMKSKSFCEDLTEGKFSYPIIHCIHSEETDTRLLSILKQRTEDVDVKRYAQALMREAGSLTHTRKKCNCLKQEILAQIEEFGGNPPLRKVIEMLDTQLESMQTELLPSPPSPRLSARQGPKVDST